jgi:hypothetical protein
VAEPLPNAPIHPALADALRADREALNRRFALRQSSGAEFDATAFQEHLRTTVNELVGRVAALQPERVRAVVNDLFDVSLDLFAAGLLGPKSRHPHVSAAWRGVLPQTARLLAREPARVAGLLSNAVDHLAAHTSARPSEWIEWMGALSPHIESVTQWLDVGKVLAWQAGLVQYRSAALRVARTLPWKLAARCFDIHEDVTESGWNKYLGRLETDRWFSPVQGKTQDASRSLRIVRTTGGFRGFGGPCLRPPTVMAKDGRLFVKDGNETWLLLADAFGTFWHRVALAPAQSQASAVASIIALDARGVVTWEDTRQDFAELAEANSFACDGQTLAVTVPTSYLVFLVARA